MALATPCPFATKSGSYYLNVRMKTALREGVGGRCVTIPLAGQSVTVSFPDKVFGSLQVGRERLLVQRQRCRSWRQPGFTDRFLDACGVWTELMASGQVEPSKRSRVWASTPRQHGHAMPESE